MRSEDIKQNILRVFSDNLFVLKDIIEEITQNQYVLNILNEIHLAIIHNDYVSVSKHAHKLKGGLSYFQVASLTETIHELEKQSNKDPDPKIIRNLYEKVVLEYQELENILRDIQNVLVKV